AAVILRIRFCRISGHSIPLAKAFVMRTNLGKRSSTIVSSVSRTASRFPLYKTFSKSLFTSLFKAFPKPFFTALFGHFLFYEGYQKRTHREIPMVLLHPEEPEGKWEE